MKLLIPSIICTLFAVNGSAQYAFNQIEVSPTSASSPKYYEEVNGVLYFQASSSSEKELWKTDGTQLGTTEVANLNGAFGTSPQSLKSYNGNLIFTSFESATGREIYRTDGTAAGTYLLNDIRSGGSSGMESGTFTFNGTRETFLDFQGELFFFANTGNGVELWKTDGTIPGTSSVKNFNNPTFGIGKYNLIGEKENLGVIFNNEIYFVVNRSGNDELWKSDGTTLGTTMVKDGLSGVHEMIVAFGEIYFVNSNGAVGQELWSSDGTTAGTSLKFDIYPGSSNSTPSDLTMFNGELYFQATTLVNGGEVFKTDGITLTLLKDINVGGSTGVGTGLRFFEYNGELYFRAKDVTISDPELWKTDGTLSGTVKAVSFAATGEPMEFLRTVIYDNKIFYTNYSQLWFTDGTDAGTQKISDNGDLNDPISQISFLHLFQSNLWFAGANNFDGVEPWYLDTSLPTSAHNIDFKEDVHVYPNPTSGLLTIKIPDNIGAVNIQVMDIAGRNISSFNGNGNLVSINMNEKPGVYFLVISIDDNIAFRKRILLR